MLSIFFFLKRIIFRQSYRFWLVLFLRTSTSARWWCVARIRSGIKIWHPSMLRQFLCNFICLWCHFDKQKINFLQRGRIKMANLFQTIWQILTQALNNLYLCVFFARFFFLSFFLLICWRVFCAYAQMLSNRENNVWRVSHIFCFLHKIKINKLHWTIAP